MFPLTVSELQAVRSTIEDAEANRLWFLSLFDLSSQDKRGDKWIVIGEYHEKAQENKVPLISGPQCL